MILADTTIWIDHLRAGDPVLAERLNEGLIAIHPFVVGEIALGSLKSRETILRALQQLPMAIQARESEVLSLIDRQPLYNLGIGYIDAHLLAAVRLRPGMRLWSRDKRLHAAACAMGVAASAASH
jgi:predicted nucleic acid-binding protein